MTPNYVRSPLRRAVCLALSAGATIATGAASAQETDAPAERATTLDRIQVTGSRIRRAQMEGALPVTVIDRAQLDTSGDVSIADFLRDTSFNSFGSFQSTSGNSALGAAQINLRGLGAARTLVLIDGRRAPTAPMIGQSQNLNAIPMAAVERIELLTDGASAIYGSDALGGVINIITRKDFDGMEFTYGIGRPSNPGGDTEEYSAIIGASSDRGRVLAGASFSGRDEIYTRDRDYWTDTPGASTYSNNFSTLRTNSLTTAGRLAHPTFGTAVPGDCINGTNLFYLSGSSPQTYTCQYNHSMISANLSSLENTAVFARGDYQVNDDWMAYFSADVTRVDSFGRFAPVPSSPWPGGAIVLPAGSPNHPGTAPEDGGLNPNYDAYYAGLADQDLYLFHRFAALGPRDNSIENTTYSFLGGFEGRLGEVDVDLGARYVESRAVNLGTNYVVGPLAQAPITSGAYNIYDPFAGDAGALGFTSTISRDMKTSMKEFFANASFDLLELPGGTAAAVIGGEYREDYYQDIYDPLSESGQIVGSSGNSSSGSREVYAGYFEVLMPFFDGFEVNVAGRYDRYSDYGSDFAPKVSVRWHPVDALTLRASYGEGFRAPTLDILNQKTTFSATFTTDPQTCELLTGSPNCQTQVTTYSIANPGLESEQSEQWSAGVVWDAADWLSLSLDYYSIEIGNQITATTLDTVVRCLRGQPGLCPAGLTEFPDGTVLPDEALGVGASFDPTTGGITGAQLGFVNLGTVKTDGFDLVARTSFDLGWARLRNHLALGRVRELSTNGGANVVDTQGFPRSRGTLNTTLDAGAWDFNWNVSYIHGTQDNAGDGRLPSWTIHNLQLSYSAPWDATLTFGVNNVADKDPVFDPATGGASYDSTLYDPWGRVPYFRYTQRF